MPILREDALNIKKRRRAAACRRLPPFGFATLPDARRLANAALTTQGAKTASGLTKNAYPYGEASYAQRLVREERQGKES